VHIAHAYGSGVRLTQLSNSCALPVWTRPPSFPWAGNIPCIFRIMDSSALTARTVQGVVRARSGQAPAWPLSSARSARRGLRGQA